MFDTNKYTSVDLKGSLLNCLLFDSSKNGEDVGGITSIVKLFDTTKYPEFISISKHLRAKSLKENKEEFNSPHNSNQHNNG